eukprot:12340707-Ditylum_brightwellii.AAC.1
MAMLLPLHIARCTPQVWWTTFRQTFLSQFCLRLLVNQTVKVFMKSIGVSTSLWGRNHGHFALVISPAWKHLPQRYGRSRNAHHANRARY